MNRTQRRKMAHKARNSAARGQEPQSIPEPIATSGTTTTTTSTPSGRRPVPTSPHLRALYKIIEIVETRMPELLADLFTTALTKPSTPHSSRTAAMLLKLMPKYIEIFHKFEQNPLPKETSLERPEIEEKLKQSEDRMEACLESLLNDTAKLQAEVNAARSESHLPAGSPETASVNG